MSVGWPELVAALEEQTRRLASVVEDPALVPALPDVPLQADGPIPDELVPRVQALLLRARDLERVAVAQQARTNAALRYGGHPQG